MRSSMLALSILVGTAQSASALTLDIPIDCEIGKTCFIQNYVDVDTSKEDADYTCGPLVYDGHKGTDFRLLTQKEMRDGVNVLAAATGKVLGIRNHMPDVRITDENRDSVKDVECGNGLVLDHGGGWETQYCHMKKGSVRVKEGQVVDSGEVLGLVGLSGLTEFPHVHLSVRKDGEVVDPFMGGDHLTGCQGERHSLWSAKAQERLVYRSSGFLAGGFSADIPTKSGAEEGLFQNDKLPASADKLLFWTEVFGILAGDIMTMEVVAPDGTVLVSHQENYPKNKAVMFQYAGKPAKGKQWPVGEYQGKYQLKRDGNIVLETVKTLEIIAD